MNELFKKKAKIIYDAYIYIYIYILHLFMVVTISLDVLGVEQVQYVLESAQYL